MFNIKKQIVILLTVALTGCTAPPTTGTQNFDFETDDHGFTAIFADYPIGEDVDQFYELKHEWTVLPAKDGKGLFLSSNNHSDDLFMGYFKEFSGFTAGHIYEFQVNFRLATNVEGGMIGVGGSPGSSVFVKGGVTSTKPQCIDNGQNQFLLNLDKGNQGVGGQDMLLLGNIEKEEALHPGQYEWKQFEFSVQAKADKAGCVWLIIGTDSGFEATSSYYLDDISLSWRDVT